MLIKRSLPENVRDDEELVDRAFADFDCFYSETYANIDGCYDGMEESMRALAARGYRIAVLSNKQESYVKRIIDLLFPDGLVEYAAGQTELPTKPDPTVPLMIAERFGVQPRECAFIGDSEVDVMTGKNAGMYSVACSWGYRPKEALEGADVIADHPSELLRIFE